MRLDGRVLSALSLTLVFVLAATAPAPAAPDGTMTWGVHPYEDLRIKRP